MKKFYKIAANKMGKPNEEYVFCGDSNQKKEGYKQIYQYNKY
jgi:hypothetical protein